jgi:hypothetical protein
VEYPVRLATLMAGNMKILLRNKFGCKMKKVLNTLFIMLFLYLAFSCNNNPVIPNEGKPGRRDYVWTVDTINYTFKTLYRLWASSPTDVWALAGGGDINKSIFHFDGYQWTTGIYILPFAPYSIYGFSAKNVYIGGENGKIWQFDGSNWQQVIILTKDGNTQIVFDNMWGGLTNDLYAFGAYPDEVWLIIVL